MMNKFEKGKTYLVERTTKVYGGGIFELTIENMTKKHLKYNGNWHKIGNVEERYTILEELEEDE